MVSNSELEAIVQLPDHALATSGNYRNFYVEDGKKYAHTIDPKTGYPVQHSLLSATVLADNCMTADAFATAFMVLGLDTGIELARSIPEIEVFFIYADENGSNQIYMSDGFGEYVKE
jgi:thiamine biosynthesis lipoprotein